MRSSMRSTSMMVLSAAAMLHVCCGMAVGQQVEHADGVVEENAQPEARMHVIFAPAAAPEGANGLKHNRGLYPVAVQFAALDRAREGDTLVMAVGANANLELIVTRVERRGEQQYSVFGYVRGAIESYFIFVRDEDALAGDLRMPIAGLHYKMKYAGANAQGQVVHFVNDVDDNQYGSCGGATPIPENAPGRGFDPVPEAWEVGENPVPPEVLEGGFGERGSCSNVQPVWDVMVVYTNLARAAIGSTTAMQAEIQLGVDTANLTFDNSNVNARYRLVYRAEITYNEVGALTDHRDRLRDPGDGFYDSVNVTRDSVNADMCSIWVDDDDAGQWCGFAFCETTADAAYICCNWDCAVSNFTYPHEHGHGQGCAHNVEDAGSCPLYSYSYGHRWTQGANSYRTVMAYNTTNGPYQRIGYWSNPDVTFNGIATGTATRDNARTLDDTARTVENFQFSQFDVWVDEDPPNPVIQIGSYGFPFDTISEGVGLIDVPSAGASELPTLHVVTGTYTTYNGTITKQMQIIPCGGAVTIGPP